MKDLPIREVARFDIAKMSYLGRFMPASLRAAIVEKRTSTEISLQLLVT